MLQILIKGGWLMIPLGICSILALAIIIERFISLGMMERRANRFIGTMRGILGSNDEKKLEKFVALCEMMPSPLSRILQTEIKRKNRNRTEIKEAIEDAGASEVPHLEKNLRILGTVVTISPLLGLLGTVMGMIKAFNVIAAQGVGQPGALAGGISEALITTAVGLSIAIPGLIFYNYFTHRTDKLIRKLEVASSEFLESLARR